MMVLTLIGCTHLDEGTIVEKTHHPMWIQHIHVGDVNSMIIHQEYWSITICDTINGEVETEDIEITEDVYDVTNVGDFYKTNINNTK